LIGSVDFGRTRSDLGRGEGPRRGAQQVDLFAQPEFESGKFDRGVCDYQGALRSIH